MKITTKTEVVNSVIGRYRSAYSRNFQLADGTWTDDIYAKLLKLNPVTAEAINKIIGNTSWTELRCDECGEDADVLVYIGDGDNFDNPEASVCRGCLTKAIKLIDSSKS